MSNSSDSTHTAKGASLARGPAWIVGSVLAVFGLVFFFKASGTPLSADGFPKGDPGGPTFLGIQINGWTAWLTAAAGVLVLIGALQHAIAKAVSLTVGIALAAAAGMALIAGDVLGLAAANDFTALGWGVAAALLIITALLPRRSREVDDHATPRRAVDHDRTRVAGEVADGDREPVTRRATVSVPSATNATPERQNGASAPANAPTGRR